MNALSILPDDDPPSMPSLPTQWGGDPACLGRIDHYDLLRKLGGGGFGVVYLARDTVSGVEVALKTLHPLLKRNAEEMDLLREKFRLVHGLTHPNIAKALVIHLVQEINVWDEAARAELKLSPGDSVMVMDYAPGVTLSKWRRQFPDGIVPFDLALEIGRQVAAALDYAHSERIVHRDVKPGNIMVETVMPPSAESQVAGLMFQGVPATCDVGHATRIRVRILDFGLAAEIRSSMSRVSTESGDTSGTRPYMAPEQWLGKKQDGRTDQYALACVLYELLSGAPPFAGVFETGDLSIMRASVANDLPEPIPGLGGPANRVLAVALSKEPARRFGSCAELLERLVGGRVALSPVREAAGRAIRDVVSWAERLRSARTTVAAWMPKRSGKTVDSSPDPSMVSSAGAASDSRRFVRRSFVELRGLFPRMGSVFASVVRRAPPPVESDDESDDSDSSFVLMSANVGGVSTPGARLSVWGQDIVLPARLQIDRGESFGPGELSFEDHDGRCYEGRFDSIRINWRGVRTVEIPLSFVPLAPDASFADFETVAKSGPRRNFPRYVVAFVAGLPLAATGILTGVFTFGWANLSLAAGAGRRVYVRDMFVGMNQFGRAFGCFALRILLVALWSLLLVVPGIVKVFSYSMTPFVLLEHPEMGVLRAIGESCRIMKGNKWRFFRFLLGFVGWWAVGVFTLGLGFLWVLPYQGAAVGAFYRAISRNGSGGPLSAAEVQVPRKRACQAIVALPLSVMAIVAMVVAAWFSIVHPDLPARARLHRAIGPSESLPRAGAHSAGARSVIPVGSESLALRWCPPGWFTMGSPTSEEGRWDSETHHPVTISTGFWMGETEVTQGQWKSLMGGETVVDLVRKAVRDDTEYYIDGKSQMLRNWWGISRDSDPANLCADPDDKAPVYFVNWSEAVRFCEILSERERAAGRLPDGYEYRLPTEAQWEYACRAGTMTALPNGQDIQIQGQNNAPALDDIAWYGGNSSVGFAGRGWDTAGWPEKQYPGGWAGPRHVGTKAANNWGLRDMIGSVCEWCADWYGSYSKGTEVDPTGPTSGSDRVLRGGSWNASACYCRSASRSCNNPGLRLNNLGFRVALVAVSEEVVVDDVEITLDDFDFE